MIQDPLFLFSILLMSVCIGTWLFENISDKNKDSFIYKNLSSIGTFAGLLMLVSIFINAGDLGIILLVASIISLITMIIGFIYKNTEIFVTSRGYFIPIFIIFVLRTFLYEPYQIPSGSMMPGLKDGDFVLVNKFNYGIKIKRVGNPILNINEPEYGDPVVIIPPHNPVPYIKRLIGKPGDVVRIINKKIYINNIQIERTLNRTENAIYVRKFVDRSQESKVLGLISSGPKIISQENDVIVDIFNEKHGDAEYLSRNIRGVNNQYPQEWTVPPGHYFVMGDNRDNSNDSTKDVGFVPRENFFGKADYIFMTWECWLCLPSFEKVGRIK
tara:strand:+ start:740 stop:1723 length:984 start_codon:yes stop_codon:yes gene_type:complete